MTPRQMQPPDLPPGARPLMRPWHRPRQPAVFHKPATLRSLSAETAAASWALRNGFPSRACRWSVTVGVTCAMQTRTQLLQL